MAYNRGYNPDALPAHAEPEQAAQLLSNTSPNPQATSPRPDRAGSWSRPPIPGSYGHSPQSSYQDKPQPPPPSARYGASGPGAPPAQSSSRPSYGGYSSPPPPQGYGQGPPPQSYHGRPPVGVNRPPPTPAPPRDGGEDLSREGMWRLFGAVDRDRTGHLSERELRAALINGDMTSFDPHTVRMMIRMFDADRSGTIDFEEFCGLWSFLAAWRNLFDRFDADHSGTISYDEFSDALVAFGYRLSPQFVTLLFRTYDSKRAGPAGEQKNGISFDLFVQACISLKRMTDVFKRYDEDRDGYITLSFEEFLTEIIRQR